MGDCGKRTTACCDVHLFVALLNYDLYLLTVYNYPQLAFRESITTKRNNWIWKTHNTTSISIYRSTYSTEDNTYLSIAGILLGQLTDHLTPAVDHTNRRHHVDYEGAHGSRDSQRHSDRHRRGQVLFFVVRSSRQDSHSSVSSVAQLPARPGTSSITPDSNASLILRFHCYIFPFHFLLVSNLFFATLLY